MPDKASPIPSEPLHPARDVNPALAPARRPPLKLVDAAGIVDAGVEVEGVDVAGLSATNLWGPLKSVQNQMDTKDFIISFENSLNFVAGNTVTLKAGTAVLSMTGYIPTKAASGVVMVNSQGEALSDRVEVETIRVPEPATFALLFLGMFGITVRRLK